MTPTKQDDALDIIRHAFMCEHTGRVTLEPYEVDKIVSALTSGAGGDSITADNAKRGE